MRSIHLHPFPGHRPPAPTGGEIIVIVVVMTLAGVLAVAGLPMFGALEFLGGAVYLACLTVNGLRAPRTLTDEGI